MNGKRSTNTLTLVPAPSSTPRAEDWLTAEEFAQAAGCSTKTVHRMRDAGVITGVLMGTRRYRYSREELDRYLHGATPAAPVSDDVEQRLATLEAQVARMYGAFARVVSETLEPSAERVDGRRRERR